MSTFCLLADLAAWLNYGDIGDGFGLGSHCMTSEVEKRDTMSNGSGLVLRRSLLTLARMLFLQQLAGRNAHSVVRSTPRKFP